MLPSSIKKDFVDYEAFGAVGDGCHDDLPAICRTHNFANDHALPVRTRPDAVYHLGASPLVANIATSTDWNTSRFFIDDTRAENHKLPLFNVCSLLAPVTLKPGFIERDQTRLDCEVPCDCYVRVWDESVRRYIRRGLNRNNGVPGQDCFILQKDGTIEGLIDWNYKPDALVEAYPIDPEPLHLVGGVFTTFANRMHVEKSFDYWKRGIFVTRSNTIVEGLTHYVAGETAIGQPYDGFIEIRKCAGIVIRDCFVTGRKIYTAQGSAGLPVTMGSYDFRAESVVNLKFENCRMNHIHDRSRWGVLVSNLCKNIHFFGCELSRVDTHMGVSGDYTIRNCQLGHMGINAIGRGTLLVENSRISAESLVRFRGDYGSTWDGDVIIKNSEWRPLESGGTDSFLIKASNDGTHNFGYPCQLPGRIYIDGLKIEDGFPEFEDKKLFLFTDIDKGQLESPSDLGPLKGRPYPYTLTRAVYIKNLQIASKRTLQISPHPELEATIPLLT